MRIVAERWASLTGLTVEQAAKDLIIMKTFFFPDKEKASAPTETNTQLTTILTQSEVPYEDQTQMDTAAY